MQLYVSIDSPTALSLYCERHEETIGSWEGKAPTLDQLNAAAEKHRVEKHADELQATTPKSTEPQASSPTSKAPNEQQAPPRDAAQ